MPSSSAAPFRGSARPWSQTAELVDSRPLGLASTSSTKTAAVPACGSVSPKRNSRENEPRANGMRDTLPSRSRGIETAEHLFDHWFDPVEAGRLS